MLKRAKRYPAEHDITVREVIELGVRQAVQAETYPFKGTGMVKDFTWDEILNIIYEGRGGTG